MAYRQTEISEAFGGEEATRPERLAALKSRLEVLYAEHRTDAAVAVQLEISVATLKRTLAKLTALNYAPKITRRPGHPGGKRSNRDR